MTDQPFPQNYPTHAQPPKNNRTCLKVALVSCLCLGAILAFAAFMFHRAWQALIEMDDNAQVRQIALALLEYEQVYHSFPPPYTVDAAGNKLHSWRTLLLPYVDERSRYEAIDFSKPWDAPENAHPRSVPIDAFGTPAVDLAQGETLFHVIVHPNGVFSGPNATKGLADIPNPHNTILVVQSAVNQATHWMQPDDYTLADFLAIDSTNSIYANGGTHIDLCDGSVRKIFVHHSFSKQIEDMVLIKKTTPTPSAPQP